MKKEGINVHSESHLKISDITDKNKPKTIMSRRIFNKKIKINNIDDKDTNDRRNK
jgi:hypothetical protein